MSDSPRYLVKIHLTDGRWVPYGPTFRSMTAAELWARRALFGQDYTIMMAGDDESDLTDAT